jgi:hypothetical protein
MIAKFNLAGKKGVSKMRKAGFASLSRPTALRLDCLKARKPDGERPPVYG